MNTSENITDEWLPKRVPVKRETPAWAWLIGLGVVCVIGSEFAPEGKGDRANELGIALNAAGLAILKYRESSNVEKESNDK